MENHNSVIAEMETTNVEIHQLDLIPQSKEGGADSVVSDAQLLKKGGLNKPTALGDVLNGELLPYLMP